MRRRTPGGGEWVGTGYLTLVLGAVIGGFAGATQWYQITLAFAVGLAVAMLVAHVNAAIDRPLHTLRERGRHDA